MNKSPGRPKGGSDKRERLLQAAHDHFATYGFRAVSLRAVARDAGVDHALVNYYFDDKEGLFAAVMGFAHRSSEVLGQALSDPDKTYWARRLLITVMSIWEDPDSGPPLIATGRAAINDEVAMLALREFVRDRLLGFIGESLGGRVGKNQAAAAGTVLAGLIFSRYIYRLEPMASLSHHDVLTLLTPSVAIALSSRLGVESIT